jgi:hypothetical protein
MEPIKINFKDCDRYFLDKTFNLNQIRHIEMLDLWLKKKDEYTINEHEDYILKKIQDILIDRVDDWNEQELIELFVGTVFALVSFNSNEYGMFSERPISAVVGDYELSGNPDAIIAKGRRRPEIPYFCFHEYKKEKESIGDPAGQCLAAMLVAQELNNNQKPIYGVTVKGEKWQFLVLQGKEYAVSTSFKATDEELFEIVKLLKHLKTIIEGYVKM